MGFVWLGTAAAAAPDALMLPALPCPVALYTLV